MEEFGYVLATTEITDENKKVGYMYREKPDNPKDSGWRFFSGEESDDFVNDPDNIRICSIDTILEKDRSVLPYLRCSSGLSFTKRKDGTDFEVSVMPLKHSKEKPV